jgi:hypothetical protein
MTERTQQQTPAPGSDDTGQAVAVERAEEASLIERTAAESTGEAEGPVPTETVTPTDESGRHKPKRAASPVQAAPPTPPSDPEAAPVPAAAAAPVAESAVVAATESAPLTASPSEAELPPAPEFPSAPVPAPPFDHVPLSDPAPPSAPQPGLAVGVASAAPRDRRVLRAVLRWTAAVLVFAAAGVGTAYGITGMERTDVPGLATESDGRWDYPTLMKPPLPPGRPGPLAEENKAGTHYADLRKLVLPAPEGATDDRTLHGTDGWLATKDFLAEYEEKEDREELAQKFTDYGLRHIAARGWTTPDGTHTRVYLLQFDTAAVVDELPGEIAPSSSPGYQLRGAADSVSDEDFPAAAQVRDVTHVVYTESKPYGAEQTRHAYLAAGDVLALVVQSRKGTANPVPFQQTVTLQSQLLG